MARQSATRAVDAIIAELAARQHGVVERLQLVAAGLTVAEIEGRVRRGMLIPLHRGVYAVGHAVLRPAGYRLAAAMACGPDAAVSWAAAGVHWQLRRSAATRIDVTVASGS